MRGWQKVLLAAVVLVTLLGAGAYGLLQTTLAGLPVHNLKYSIDSISLRQLQLSQLSFSLDNPTADIHLTNLRLNWQWFTPRLTGIRVDGGDIRLTSWPSLETDKPAPAAAPAALPTNWQLPPALPDDIAIEQLALQLPCGQNRCRYLLSAALTRQAQLLQYQLTLTDSDNLHQPRLRLSGDYQTVQQLPLLNLQLNLDDSTRLTLRQQLAATVPVTASGKLQLDIAPPSPWLLQQFNLWQIALPQQAITRFSSPVTLHSDWQLQLPSEPTLANIAAAASGNWQLSAQIPAPLILPGIGQLQGSIDIALALEQGELSRYQLDSRLQLLQPELSGELLQLGINSDVLHIGLIADGQNRPQLTALPLNIQLSSEGATALTLSGNATINLTPPLSAQLQQGQLTLRQKQLKPAPDTVLDTLELQSTFNGYWLADQWQLDVRHAKADIAALTAQAVTARDVSLTLAGSRLQGDSSLGNIKLSSDATLSVAQLNQQQLKPLSWQWQAKLEGTLDELQLDGHISNSANLGLAHQLRYQPGKLAVDWQLDEIFLLAGNPLAASFTAWPALLEVNRGRLGGSGQLDLLPTVNASAALNLSGVNGIYDRSLFKELTAVFQLQYQQQQLNLSTANARLAEISHGVVVGPLSLSARYRAAADSLTAGKLDVTQLQLQAMGGHVRLQPQLIDLSLAEQQLLLELKQIDISQLLQQHPSTDISGNGRISGTIPLLLGRNGASVQNGFIAAESPGGKLQYRPPTAQSMAATNPGMKVVLEALDDFHYSVLSSNVSYDTNGKLLLALKLQGQNPALEAGRPINLNINLEEDIPALITSLQLSSQISDKIKQRVQQKLQQSGAARANGAQP